MHWQDEGIILSIHAHSESNAILKVFTRKHGVYSGFARASKSKKGAALMQTGNIGKFSWSSKIEGQLGSLSFEIFHNSFQKIYFDKQKTLLLASICELLLFALPEHETYEELYEIIHHILSEISEKEAEKLMQLFLYYLLQHTGFSLNLESCAVCGSLENLAYISPKSARAVCETDGYMYRDILFSYKHFKEQNTNEIIKILLYFVQKNLLSMKNQNLPISVQLFMKALSLKHTI